MTRERKTLTTCCAAHTLHDGFSDVTYVLLPLLAQTFGLSLAQVGMIRSAHRIAMAAFQIPAGLIAERFGERNLLALGTIIAGLAFLALGYVSGFWAILIANLLTEGRGMAGFTAADAIRRIEGAIKRPVDVVITNVKWPSSKVLGRYALEHKEPLALGDLPDHSELVGGDFWRGEIARHDRLRLAYAVWSVLSRRLLGDS